MAISNVPVTRAARRFSPLRPSPSRHSSHPCAPRLVPDRVPSSIVLRCSDIGLGHNVLVIAVTSAQRVSNTAASAGATTAAASSFHRGQADIHLSSSVLRSPSTISPFGAASRHRASATADVVDSVIRPQEPRARAGSRVIFADSRLGTVLFAGAGILAKPHFREITTMGLSTGYWAVQWVLKWRPWSMASSTITAVCRASSRKWRSRDLATREVLGGDRCQCAHHTEQIHAAFGPEAIASAAAKFA